MGRLRRPARDERWIGPDGDVWQITEVVTRQEGQKAKEVGEGNSRRVRLVSAGARALAYYRVRHIETGVDAQVPARSLPEWSRKDPDPLQGHRLRITERIRAGAGTFTLPVELVFKGEMYHLPCGVIRVDKVSEKLVKGQKDREWVVSFTRLIEEREYFLRSVTPKLKPGEKPGEATAAEAAKARIEGNYSRVAEPGGDPLPVVHPDWEDKGVAKREIQRQKAVKDRMTEERVLKEATNAAARVKQEIIERGAKGEDLTYLLADIYERLNARDELEEAA